MTAEDVTALHSLIAQDADNLDKTNRLRLQKLANAAHVSLAEHTLFHGARYAGFDLPRLTPVSPNHPILKKRRADVLGVIAGATSRVRRKFLRLNWRLPSSAWSSAAASRTMDVRPAQCS